MQQVKHRDMGEKLNKYEVSEGQEVILDWYPYDWAKREIGALSPVKGEITKISGPQKSGYMCDIIVDVEGFEGNLTVHLDNGYVTTGIGGSPFDKGRFGAFYGV